MPNCIIQAVQFFTAIAGCISEWREREGDGFNSVLVEARIFFSNTIVLDFKSNYGLAAFTNQFLLILWSNLNSSMYQVI